MTRWRWAYKNAEEIRELLKETLQHRSIVKEHIEAVEVAEKNNTYIPKDFDGVDELAEYVHESDELWRKVVEARLELRSAEDDLESRYEGLKSVIPPGGSVRWRADDGTEYHVRHQNTNTGKGSIGFFPSKRAEVRDEEWE